MERHRLAIDDQLVVTKLSLPSIHSLPRAKKTATRYAEAA
jgi:hypothetical protein